MNILIHWTFWDSFFSATMIKSIVKYDINFSQYGLTSRGFILLNNNPLKHGGGRAVRPSPPFYLPFTQTIMRHPIPENSWPCKHFCCGCPYEKKIYKFGPPPPQGTLKYPSKNHPCTRGLSGLMHWALHFQEMFPQV